MRAISRSWKVASYIDVGIKPTRITTQPDQQYLWVANEGDEKDGGVTIIDLPNNAGHLVLTVFVKESTRPSEMQERAIAQIARAAYDYFLFNHK